MRVLVKQVKSSKLEKEKDISNRNSRLPIIEVKNSCNFYGYDIENLMKETSTLREIVTKSGT
jgi:hypothetical protein